MYEVFPVNSEEDYQKALALVEPFLGEEFEKGTDIFNFFEVMITLIEKYEAVNYPLSKIKEI